MHEGSLAAYDFSTWDLSWPEYHRWSINFFAFNSSDLSGPLISNETDDEASSLLCPCTEPRACQIDASPKLWSRDHCVSSPLCHFHDQYTNSQTL